MLGNQVEALKTPFPYLCGIISLPDRVDEVPHVRSDGISIVVTARWDAQNRRRRVYLAGTCDYSRRFETDIVQTRRESGQQRVPAPYAAIRRTPRVGDGASGDLDMAQGANSSRDADQSQGSEQETQPTRQPRISRWSRQHPALVCERSRCALVEGQSIWFMARPSNGHARADSGDVRHACGRDHAQGDCPPLRDRDQSCPSPDDASLKGGA